MADISVTKSGDEAVPRGGTITYNIVVTNAGPDSASNTIATDTIPAHTDFVNAVVSTGSFSFGSGTVTANFGTLAFLDSAVLTITVRIKDDTPRNTVISNTATATSAATDPDGSNNSSTALTTVLGPFSGDVLISEFRLRGPGVAAGKIIKGQDPAGAQNEFIEIYNNTGGNHTVTATSGSGYAIVASDGLTRCVIPNGTTIPARGHFLCVNSIGYSLGSYATGDATYTTDIPDNAGIALFDTDIPANFNLANRLDAVGSTSEANTLYKEGTGYPALTPSAIDYSFYRDACGRQGSIPSLLPCTISTGVIDTDNNANDFIFVDTNGTSAGAGQRLGAPGPENLSSPVESNATYVVSVVDPCVAASIAPNQVRDLTSDPANNSTFGTIELRRTITNQGLNPVSRLRFRVTQQTTFPAPSGTADLRVRTSSDTSAIVDRTPCGSGTTSITINGTTLEQPPSQPNGGAFNSSVSAGIINLKTPLPPGESVDVRFLWGVQQTGKFRVVLNIEVVETPVIEERPSESQGKGVKR